MTKINPHQPKEISTNELALMIKEGFDNMSQQFVEVNQRLTNLEQGHEQIILRLDNVAYRFEIKELDQRVTRLEHEVGLSA